jgi:hypothetical protein
MGILPLRGALKRGALLVIANWPVIFIDFGVESFYKAALGVPVLGGALMVGALVGTDLREVVADGVGPTASLVLGSLENAPVALIAFLAALALVGIGGEVLMFVVKGGTLAVLVQADRDAGDVQDLPLGADALRPASAFRLEGVLDGARRFARRSVTLALGLGAVYMLVGGTYLGVVTYGVSIAAWAPLWPLLVAFATSAGVVVLAVANLAYDLLRVILITDDCSVSASVTRLWRFVVADARQVIGIFSVIGAVELLTGAGALLAAAGLTPVAYLPLIGLVIVPLQVALWLVRGLLFEGMALVTLSAYQTQYRRFATARAPAGSDLAPL